MTLRSGPHPRELHGKIPTTSLSFAAGSAAHPYCFTHKHSLHKHGMTTHLISPTRNYIKVWLHSLNLGHHSSIWKFAEQLSLRGRAEVDLRSIKSKKENPNFVGASDSPQNPVQVLSSCASIFPSTKWSHTHSTTKAKCCLWPAVLKQMLCQTK